MEQIIREEIRRFVLESPDNRFPDGERRYFDEPLIGFAGADDPLFGEFKQVIGAFHLTPTELMRHACGRGPAQARTVICWILPISKATRKSNRTYHSIPSREWALTREEGERFNTRLRVFLVEMLKAAGARAVAPLLSEMWRTVKDPRVGLASTWSERHAAYVAGLGTFSLNDGFITAKGIAHRCGSVITDLYIPPTRRTSGGPWSHCLSFRNEPCGLCIQRCPANAISPGGHDKSKCQAYLFEDVGNTAGKLYGIVETGCGLCQTKVPCEERIP